MNENVGMSEHSGCFPKFLLVLVFFTVLYFLAGEKLLSEKSNSDEPKKELTKAEWHALQMEMAMLRAEVAEVKAINKMPIPLSLIRFTQKLNTTEATVTLRNNLPKSIMETDARLFYLSMSGKVIAYCDMHLNHKIEPGMATSFDGRGCQLPEGYAYYKNCPDNTPEDKKYKVQIKIMNYKTR